ncbi:1,5-anhydro-D-fructose reductase-like [Liolophura sinensis]|uniref:1,5-anhydro-D-fructose reductase-like n=1 Tax=Liolophura sinensis TaxID=3198878 RepID=UPI00315949DF
MASIGKHVLMMNNKRTVPLLGLGTWQSSPGEVKQATKVALECGYRHIDTAQAYGNEAEIGDAIQEFLQATKTPRDELFITTKLAMPFMGADTVKPACQNSLKKLKLDVIDLFLIHTPLGMKYMGLDKPWAIGPDGKVQFEAHDLVACWKAMEKLVDEGLVRSIGVSNFNSEQITRILKNCRIKPVTNQVECHAYFPQEELSSFLKEKDMLLTAYAPFASPGRPKAIRKPDEGTPLLEHPVIADLAKKYKKTPAQILLRNLIQRGMVVIPKSTNPTRIQQNAQVFDFELSETDQTAIAGLKNGKRLFDGSSYGANTHPENPFVVPF